MLGQTEVDLSRYGRIDLSGLKDGEPHPNPKVWDSERECWSDSWKENMYDFEVKYFQQLYEEMRYRLADKLPTPKTLIEIADYGIANPECSLNAFGEILEQAYNTDKFHSLIVIDGYNDWFKPSLYPSYRYVNNNKLKGHIPPQDIAMVRLLMKFDGHKIRNGFKICSTTHYRQFNHLCTPDVLNLPNGYHA